MTIKQKVRKTIETVVFTTPFWLPFGAQATVSILENSHYNSLSRQGKIEYLENRIRFYKEHPPITNPRFGGAMFFVSANVVNKIEERLYKLENSQ